MNVWIAFGLGPARLALERFASAQRAEHPLANGRARQADLLVEERRLAVRHVAVGQAHAHHAGALCAGAVAVLEVLEDG